MIDPYLKIKKDIFNIVYFDGLKNASQWHSKTVIEQEKAANAICQKAFIDYRKSISAFSLPRDFEADLLMDTSLFSVQLKDNLIRIFRNSPNKLTANDLDVISQLLTKALESLEENTPEISLSLCNEILPLLISKAPNDYQTGRCYQLIGNAYEDLANYQLAIDNYILANIIFKNHPTQEAQCLVLHSIGKVYFALNNFEVALNYCKQSLKKREEFDKHPAKPLLDLDKKKLDANTARLYQDLGNLYKALSNYKDAANFYFRASLIFERLKDVPAMVTTISQQASLEVQRGNLTKAFDLYTQAISKLGAHPEKTFPITYSFLLSERGLTYVDSGEYPKAQEDLLKASLIISHTPCQKENLALILTNLASVYSTRKMLREAEETIDEACKIYNSLNDFDDKAHAYYIRGGIYVQQDRLIEAEQDFNNSIRIFSQLNNHISIANVYMNLGRLFYKKANYPIALHYMLQALNIYKPEELEGSEKLNHPYAARLSELYNNIGLVYMEQGRIAEAVDFFEESLEYRCSNQEKANTLLNLSSNLIQRRDSQIDLRLKTAIDYANQALSLIQDEESAEMANSFYQLAYELSYFNHSEAKIYAEKSLKIFSRIHHDTPHRDIANGLSLLAKFEEDRTKRISLYEQALGMFSQNEEIKQSTDAARIWVSLGFVYGEQDTEKMLTCYENAENCFGDSNRFGACLLREELADNYLKIAATTQQSDDRRTKAMDLYHNVLLTDAQLLKQIGPGELADWDLSIHLRITEKLSNAYKQQGNYTASATVWMHQADLFRDKQPALAVHCLDMALDSYRQISGTEDQCALLWIQQAKIDDNAPPYLKRRTHTLHCLKQIPPKFHTEESKQLITKYEAELIMLQSWLTPGIFSQLDQAVEDYYSLQLHYIQDFKSFDALSEYTKNVTIDLILALGNILDQCYLRLAHYCLDDPLAEPFYFPSFESQLSLDAFISKEKPFEASLLKIDREYYDIDSLLQELKDKGYVTTVPGKPKIKQDIDFLEGGLLGFLDGSSAALTQEPSDKQPISITEIETHEEYIILKVTDFSDIEQHVLAQATIRDAFQAFKINQQVSYSTLRNTHMNQISLKPTDLCHALVSGGYLMQVSPTEFIRTDFFDFADQTEKEAKRQVFHAWAEGTSPLFGKYKNNIFNAIDQLPKIPLSQKKLPQSYQAILKAQPFHYYDASNGKDPYDSWLDKVKEIGRESKHVDITGQSVRDDLSAKMGTLRLLQRSVDLHYQEFPLRFWSFFYFLPTELNLENRINLAKQIYASLQNHLASHPLYKEYIPGHPQAISYAKAVEAGKPALELDEIKRIYTEKVSADLPVDARIYAKDVADILLCRALRNLSPPFPTQPDFLLEVLPFLQNALENIYSLTTQCGQELHAKEQPPAVNLPQLTSCFSELPIVQTIPNADQLREKHLSFHDMPVDQFSWKALVNYHHVNQQLRTCLHDQKKLEEKAGLSLRVAEKFASTLPWFAADYYRQAIEDYSNLNIHGTPYYHAVQQMITFCESRGLYEKARRYHMKLQSQLIYVPSDKFAIQIEYCNDKFDELLSLWFTYHSDPRHMNAFMAQRIANLASSLINKIRILCDHSFTSKTLQASDAEELSTHIKAINKLSNIYKHSHLPILDMDSKDMNLPITKESLSSVFKIVKEQDFSLFTSISFLLSAVSSIPKKA